MNSVLGMVNRKEIMDKYKIGVLIAAAGMSSRMKDFKPLMPMGDKTVIETTIENYKLLGINRIVIVIGHQGYKIKELLKDEDIIFVKNESYETSHMFDSICLGIKEIANTVDLLFITPADSPFVQQFTLKKMLEEINTPSIKIIQPSYMGKNGHPLLLKKEAFRDILDHDGTMGLQGVIAKMGKKCKNISFEDPGLAMDADLQKDYLNLLKFNEDKRYPTVDMCRRIQDYFHMTDEVKRHCEKVAEEALNICRQLNNIDTKKVVAAALLHDIAKGKPNHAKVGAQWLKDMGYEEISEIVAEHMELNSISSAITEKEVVFLADKLIYKDKLVTINERFSNKENMYKNNKEALQTVERRKKQAEILYNMIYGSC